MNPRIKQRSVGLLNFIGAFYHEDPHNILPLILKPISGARAQSAAAPKYIKSRLEFAHDMLVEYGVGSNKWAIEVY
jgi:hypothetical protein